MQNKWNGLGFLNNDIYQQATNQTRERHIFDDFEHDTNLEIVTIVNTDIHHFFILYDNIY